MAVAGARRLTSSELCVELHAGNEVTGGGVTGGGVTGGGVTWEAEI